MRDFDRTKRAIKRISRTVRWHAARAIRTVRAPAEVRRAALAARRYSDYQPPQARYLRALFPERIAVAALQVNWELTELGARDTLSQADRYLRALFPERIAVAARQPFDNVLDTAWVRRNRPQARFGL